MLLRTRDFVITLALLFNTPGFAQRRVSADAIASTSLDELAARPRTFAAQPEGRREIYEPGRARPQRYKGPVTAAPLAGEIAAPAAGVNSIAPSFGGFQGLQDDFTAIPPDTTGAVGPQHIVTMLNTQVQIQSRSGVVRANYPINLGGASGFWSPLGVFTDVFDPRILYDPASDRWIACAVINA